MAMILKTPYADAEELKKEDGCAMRKMVGEREIISLPPISGRQKERAVSRAGVATIIEYRVVEMLNLIEREIARSKIKILSGIVLTGGTALLEGLTELAEYKFRETPWGMSIPVRLGKPKVERGMVREISSPIYSTGVGLVLYGAEKQLRPGGIPNTDDSLTRRIINKLKKWLKDYF